PLPPGPLDAALEATLKPLVAQLRQQAGGEAIARYWRGERPEPPAISEFALIRGRPAIVAVMPILGRTPMQGDPGAAPILASIDYLDTALAAEISSQYQVGNAAFVLRPTGTESERQVSPIVNSQGRFIAFLEWNRERPGQLILAGTGPALAGGFVLTAILVLILMAQLRRSAVALEAGRRRAEYQAAHDRLTGLPNRSGFDAHLTAMLRAPDRQGARIDLLMLDLDRFKQVNDTLGHQAGDELICRVAERLRRVLG